MQHTRVHNASRERAHQVRVRDAAEVVREVGVHNVQMALVQRLFRIDHRLLGIAARSIGVLFGRKVGFEVGSSTSIVAVMHTRSRRVDIPSGLNLPLD